MLSFPRQRSVFENILTGLNTAATVGLGIANFVKSSQNQAALQEGRELEGIASRIKLAQAINPNQPVSLNEGLGARIEKAGVPVPRLTPEKIAQTQDLAVSQAPGSITLPKSEVEVQTEARPMTISSGGQATPMAEVQRRQQEGKSIAESLGTVGGYAPIIPRGKKLAIIDYAGGVSTKNLPPGVDQVIQQKKPEQEHWLFNAAGEPVANMGGARPHFLPKPDKTSEQLEKEAAAKARGRESGSSPIQELDPDTGLPVRTYKRRPFYSKTDTSQVPIITEDQAEKIALKGGKVPKGAKILKKSDPEYKIWNQARNEVVKKLSFSSRSQIINPGPDQDAFIQKETEKIFRERMGQSKLEGKGKQSSGADQTYQLPKGGQMVPVDKATYDEYWRVHGGKK